MDRPAEPVRDVTTTAALGWGVYLACSWTWVIGMFLPVLLVRDFGLWGWILFAVPNVVGAASVGWVMRSPEHSAEFTLRHAPAVGLFSAVTIAFQVFTLGWLAVAVLGGAIGLPLAVIVAALPMLGRYVPLPAQPLLAILVWLFSATIGVILLSSGWIQAPALRHESFGAVAGLAAACTLGFLLCPYLDVTLQAARQATGRRSRLAFGVGYSVFFLAMIGLTLGYASGLPGLMLAEFDGLNRLAGVLIIAHLAAQVAFTNLAHVSALTNVADAVGTTAGSIRPSIGWFFWSVLLALLGGLLTIDLPISTAGSDTADFSFDNTELFGYTPAEFAYRGFLTFYGLLFPAYLLLGLRVRFWIALMLAAPFFALGFFGGETGWSMGWAVVGVGIVLVARLTGRRASAPPPPPDDR